jgi:hypothetical protein
LGLAGLGLAGLGLAGLGLARTRGHDAFFSAA